jgi:5-formyltetrahydrofolate cyclo-ligase
MLKKEARNIYRQKRQELSEPERTKLDDLLLIQFQTINLPFIHALLSFWPIEENNEPDTHLFTEFMRFRNPEMKICYPVSDFSIGRMQAVVTDIDTAFVPGPLNIHEPSSGNVLLPVELDLIFVPLLAFDEIGFRVGYGKGFYDKYLADCRPDCIKVGFSYFDPVSILEDRDEFDVPLNLCITPRNFYVF